MNKIKITLLSFLFSIQGYAQESFMTLGERKSISLDGSWNYIVDPYENGYYNYRWEPNPNGYFKNEKSKNKWDHIEYNFDISDTLTVPGDWNSQRKELFLYEGTIWYKKSFDFEKKNNTRVFLRFGAANYIAIVYLNGEKLGQHEGGFTPFSFEITNLVREKDNFIIVKVDNKRCAECVPTLNTDWWNYGGLTRSVSIIETPATFISDYVVQLKKESAGEISGWIQLNGSKLHQKVSVALQDANIRRQYKTDSSGFVKFSFPASVKLWSPENPVLHEVIVSSEADTISSFIGFRTIGTKGTQILLNGKPVFLRGISIHEEAPFRSGRANSVQDARTLLGWAKELGCNFVRLAHYPHSENMIKEAEKLG